MTSRFFSSSLIELLRELAALHVELLRSTEAITAALLRRPDGRRLLLLERTYRDGVVYLLDPSDDEIELARHGDLWTLWNSEHGVLLGGIA